MLHAVDLHDDLDALERRGGGLGDRAGRGAAEGVLDARDHRGVAAAAHRSGSAAAAGSANPGSARLYCERRSGIR